MEEKLFGNVGMILVEVMCELASINKRSTNNSTRVENLGETTQLIRLPLCSQTIHDSMGDRLANISPLSILQERIR